MEELAKNNPEMFVKLILEQDDKRLKDAKEKRSLIRQISFMALFLSAFVACVWILH
ncbi:hypothetical protein [Helicobacter cetorum]|uniref:hypothetical protein n=1 Tax=Helicobacter cetorum TaxID=138563 RepID=UPI00031A8FD2|nr:hypothetical protein [Helicobacter cetorum]